MDRKTTVALLGLLLIVLLCLHLVTWLHVGRLQRELQDLGDRPTILFPVAAASEACDRSSWV